MSKKANNFSLSMVKYNAFKLRKQFQLPYLLVYHISILKNDTDLKWVVYLKSMTEHLLRVKGYYKKYPDEEKKANEIIECAFKEFIGQ